MKRFGFYILFVFLLASCVGDQMRQQLAMLQEYNQNDSLLTNDSLAISLCEYFNDHGTANEQVLAHYLLARTYADMGQSPRALDEFHRAVELADTASADCDFKTLARVYGQMGDLLRAHFLSRYALNAYQKAYHYSVRAGETAIAPLFYAQQKNCYYALSLRDSSEYITKNTIRMFLDCGDTLSANIYKGPLSYFLVEKKDFAYAWECLNDYEHHSYINEEALKHSDRWKMLYFYKGFYYQHVHRCDSALHYYYKTIQTSQNPNNVTLGLKGLYETYQMLHLHDSVSKYAVLYAEKNDETFRISTATTLLSMQHLYDYHHYETLAEQKTLEAARANQKLTVLILCLVILIVASLFIILTIRSRHIIEKQKIVAKYTSALHGYISTKKELQHLREQSTVNEHLVRQAKEDLEYFQRSITGTRQKFSDIDHWGMVDTLEKTAIVEQLKKKGIKGMAATEQELHDMRRTFNLYQPGFSEALYAKYIELSIKELTICMFIKLHFAPSQICSLIQMRSSALSNLRKRLLAKMFNIDGGATMFDDEIRKISYEVES